MTERGGWTLETLKEHLDSRVADLKTYVDQRFDASDQATNAALVAAKENTKASFEASEKAIVKAEDAQKSYNQTHNDLARKMDDQSKATMPRPETEQRFHNVEEKIANLRDLITNTTGTAQGGKEAMDSGRAWILAAVSVLGFLAMLAWKLMGR